jgi:hypothetical protein
VLLRGAEARVELERLCAELATDLANGLASAFLKRFDRAMPGYEELRRDVEALVASADISASIEVRETKIENDRAQLEADWYLQVKLKRDLLKVRQKRELVRLNLRRNGKRWLVESLAPPDFFRLGG